MKKLSILAPLALLLSSCGSPPIPGQVQSQQQEALSQQGNAVAGMPAIHNFREKKLLKMVYEMRDQELSTVTYTLDMNGRLHKLCDSVGYGIPYATQYTNPQRADNYHPVALPQADPNGLFSPASADGTWVLCANPKTNGASPVYVEPKVIVSPFPLQ